LAKRALIVIDVQKGFSEHDVRGERNNPACEENVGKLIAAFRAANQPIVFVKHNSKSETSVLHPSKEGNEFKDVVSGTPDLLVTKSVNSAFYGEPDLDAWLKSRGVTRVTICGITTDHCCSTTARMADNLGYSVDFVLDATHTHDRTSADGATISADDVARVNVASLAGEFAKIITTAEAVSR
jgi:nicotinamidase-related amidase